jgi:hypothetical protein
MRFRVIGLLVLVCCFTLDTPATAQENTAELRGRVVDSQDAGVPGVTILVTNEATGVYRQTVSTADGSYFLTSIAPGIYTLEAELSGFQKYNRKGVRLDLGRTATLDIQLSPGAVTETITVTAETPLVDLTSKEIGGNVTNREVTMLPSVNGNFVGMVALLPGVISNVSTESFGSDAISANGLDSRNNNFMLDGANNNDDVIGQRAGSQARTPLEAVAEFQVVTNQYDAEFGRTTGAIINAISKSGTNAFHGVGAGLWQDAGLTKKDYFVKQNGLTKPDTQLQTYRANIGGPIVRDKAHFFFNVERVMVDRANTITIPARPEFNASPVTQDRVWNTLLRFDHQLSASNTWAVRWLRESSPQLNQIIPVTLTAPVTGTFPVTQNASREENDVDQTVVVSLNSVLGNNRFNTFRVNFTQEDVAFANPNFNGGNQDQGALQPTLIYTSFVDQQSNVAQARVNNAYQIDDTMSWFISGHGGSHDLKFGAQYEYVGADSTAQDNLNGTFFFRSDQSFNASDPRTYPDRLQIRVPGALNRYQKAHYVAAFVQDKWRLNRATISLGLRYDLEVQPIAEVDNPAFADPSEYPVDTNNIAPRLGLTYDLTGDGQSVVRGGYGRFYDKTHFELISAILTAGAFSDSFNVLFPANNFDPGPAAGHFPTDPMLAGGPTVNRALVAASYPAGTRIRNTGTVWLDNPDRVIPHTDQITAGYERQLFSTLSVSADYVHARARNQFMLRDLNPGLRTSPARTAPVVRIDPAYVGQVSSPINEGDIDYDALQMSLVKRFASDYSFRVSYTLGYSRGNTPGVIATGAPLSGFQLLDDLNLDLNEGPTNVDRRHNLVISGQALVPRAHGLTLAWVVRALSGTPLSLFDSTTDPDLNGQFTEPLPAGSYSGTPGPNRNPWDVDFESTRNGARGPGLFQADVRFGYRLRPGQNRSLDLFMDVFNITNRANFENPIGDRRLPDFLNLTALRAGAVPTTVQFGVRMAF